MNTSTTGRGDVSYLAPLFSAAAAHRGDNRFLLLPDPAERSRLAKDDEPLKSRGAAKFIQSSFSAGLIHVEAFTKLVVVAHQIDPYSPWTLLRGALENFATATWLLPGAATECHCRLMISATATSTRRTRTTSRGREARRERSARKKSSK
ncbi:hypothetical protein [Streptomyces sp. NPDC048419]|uniref:hypothetical protein n=1 Tax=Streptomyces sp. NPDC048419 TaxID=3365547 RepID=UPI0037175FAD